MTLKAFLAAALVFAAGASPVAFAAPAEAQQTRTVVTERTVVRRDGPRYRAGYRNGHRNRYVTRRVCTNRFRDGRRVRVCRTVRRYR